MTQISAFYVDPLPEVTVTEPSVLTCVASRGTTPSAATGLCKHSELGSRHEEGPQWQKEAGIFPRAFNLM